MEVREFTHAGTAGEILDNFIQVSGKITNKPFESVTPRLHTFA
jgi:hypothetical protein